MRFLAWSLQTGSRSKRRKRFYEYKAIDDCTRIRILKICERNNENTAIQFINYGLEQLPGQLDSVQTDNGSGFEGVFQCHVLDRGINHIEVEPTTLRLNGKVERFHRIHTAKFYWMLDGLAIDDAELLSDKLQEWENLYTFNRPQRPPWTDP
jgi:hypothetical protein